MEMVIKPFKLIYLFIYLLGVVYLQSVFITTVQKVFGTIILNFKCAILKVY